MKHVLFVLAFLLVLGGTSRFGFAQSRIVHKVIQNAKSYPPQLGRDLWFTMCQNYDAGGGNGKYYMLYVTSPNTTTVNIQITGSAAKKYAIQADQVVAFMIPLSWEVTTSGIVETKAIRVWSNNADLTAYLLSRNPFTSDGMYIIPNIGWGLDYVVAGYTSLFESSFDYPSEFSVVANQDNTVAQITPIWDIRATGQPNTVLHARNKPFAENFTRGTCAQYQLTLAQNPDDYDVTGTLVSGNVPVGIVGASQCPNIPPDFPYCDHICDMIPPIRTWAATYYTAPFARRSGGDSYMVIASDDGQTIYRKDASSGLHVFAVLNKYQFLRDPGIDQGSKWYSDKPFLLVQYINSTTWPGVGPSNNGIGDPAMVVINGVEQFVPKIVFQTPTILGGQSSFQNFFNVIIPAASQNTTYVDGKRVNSGVGTKVQIDGLYEAWRFPYVAQGTHKIVSDAGVGCYVYGYGSYDSYAWTGSYGTKTFGDKDTIPPVVDTSGLCFCADVKMKDVHPGASKLSSYTLDSVTNMYYVPDPSFVAGSYRDSSFYDMCVIDSTLPAYLQVTVYDVAGNATTIQSTYRPQTATILPFVQNFGTGTNGVEKVLYDTIVNTGVTNFSLDILFLKNGSFYGFSIDSADRSPLKPGERRLIKVGFTAKFPPTVHDTIIFGDACVQGKALLLGNGGQPDFAVTDDDFGCILVGSSAQNTKVALSNGSPVNVTIDSIWVDDPVHFQYTGTVPILLPAKTTAVVNVPFKFTPSAVNPRYITSAHFRSSGPAGTRSDSLIGCGIAPASIFYADSVVTISCGGSASFGFTLESNSRAVTKVTTLKHSDSTSGLFAGLSLVDQYGNPVTLPHNLSLADSKVYVTLNFTAPNKKSGVYRDTIWALDDQGAPIMQNGKAFVVATAVCHYREFSIDKPLVALGRVPYGSAPVSGTFSVFNSAQDSVVISSLTPTGPYADAFTLTPSKTLPFGLAAGEKIDVNVSFDPSKHPIDSQWVDVRVSTTACVPIGTTSTTASLKYGSSAATGFTNPAIFACSTQLDSVTVTNGNPPLVIDTIVNVQSSSVNFVPTFSPGMTLAGGKTLYIPVVFAPTPGGGVVPYTGTITIRVRDTQGRDTTLTVTVSGSATGMNSTVSSLFAVPSVVAGSAIALPIQIAVQKNGLATPLAAAGLNGVRLVYTYDQDQLNIGNGNIAAAVTNRFGDWTVDPAKSSLDPATGTLVIAMNGTTPLADGVNSLGSINFQQMLTKTGDQRFNVKLDTALFLVNGVATSSCLATTTSSGDFGLVYQCGDRTIQTILNGGQLAGFAEPAHPNPASMANHVVTFGYATRGQSEISLIIYDALGKEVARVVDNVMHEPGVYEVHYDISKLQSGTYNYRLSTRYFTGTRSFVVTK